MSLDEIAQIIDDKHRLVRAIFSGRRRNMQPEFEKIELRPISLRDEIKLQMTTTNDTKSKTTNINFGEFKTLELLNSGFANCLVEATDTTLTMRFTKKGEPQIFVADKLLEQNTAHDRQKARLFDAKNDFFKLIGISDRNGLVKPSMNDKYLQIEEFLRILVPLMRAEISAGRLSPPTSVNPLRIVDHGCGNAYLTFAVHHFLNDENMPNEIVGIDKREESRIRNSAIATQLSVSQSVSFRAEKIANSEIARADIAIALHACDTATDDAIAWSITNGAKIVLVSPCCHHELQTQMTNVPEPWSMITKHGILKERFADILTDSLRAQILRLHGYRCEVIEFIGDEHTPRNLLIRASFTGAKADEIELNRYRETLKFWSIRPRLAEILNFE